MKRFVKKPALCVMILALFLAPILCCCFTNAAMAAGVRPAVEEAQTAHAHCHKEEAPEAPDTSSQEEAECECPQLSAVSPVDSFILLPPVPSVSDSSAVLDQSVFSEVIAHKEHLNLSFLSPPVENNSPIYLTLANFRL